MRLHPSKSTLAVWGSLVVAAIFLAIEAHSEPYHIDELRQVRPYAADLKKQVGASFSQEQPPLDVLAGGVFQTIFGIGHATQRLHSVIFAMFVLAGLAWLLKKSGHRWASYIFILLTATSSIFISNSAYARPYALPFALMVGFLIAAHYALENDSKVALIALVPIALLLPMSRVFEPPAFLAFTGITVLWYSRTRPKWKTNARWITIICGAGIILSGVPVYLQLRSRLGAYGDSDTISLSAEFHRLLNNTFPTFRSGLGLWWLLLPAIIIGFTSRRCRRAISNLWWWWPLFLSAAGFAVAFHIQARAPQPFYDRYLYFWIPIIYCFIAVVAEIAFTHDNGEMERYSTRLAARLAVVLTASLIVTNVLQLYSDFRNDAWLDYAEIGGAIESNFPPETSLFFDTLHRPVGTYDPGFAGRHRYKSPSRFSSDARAVIRDPGRIPFDRPYVFVLVGKPLDVDGWTSFAVGDQSFLYRSNKDLVGSVERLAQDFEAFGKSAGPVDGADMQVAAAVLTTYSGQPNHACDILDRLYRELSTADLSDELVDLLETSPQTIRTELDSCSLKAGITKQKS